MSTLRSEDGRLAGTGRLFSVLTSVFICVGIAMTAAGVVEAIPAAAQGITTYQNNRPASATGCPATAVCVSLPCKHAGHCPTVEATPTAELGVDQWVYLNLSNFPQGNEVQIGYCADTSTISAKSEPLCDAYGTATLEYPQQVLPIFPNATATTSFHVELNPPSPGNTPFSGIVPGSNPQVVGNFSCDDGPALCSIDVIDPDLNSGILEPSPKSTLVIPVHFAAASNGCPGAKFVFTSSDFSVEQLFPHESPFACASSQPVIAVDTAGDAEQAISSLTSGATSVAFVTDPLSPDVQQALAATHQKYSIIPIAASALVVGYGASMEQGVGTFYGYSSMRLTPAEVAGVITYNFASPYTSDMVQCPAAVVTQLNQTPSPAGPCPLVVALNDVKGYVPANNYGAFIPAYHSGLTRELIDWIRSSPNVPVKLDGYTIHDPNTPAHELTTSVFDPSWPITSCKPFDQFPPVPSPSNADYALLSSPATQGKFLRTYLPPPQYENHPAAGFAPVDWSEARYEGFDIAALQNAAGNFVTPSVRSIDAALAAAKVGPNGVLEPSFTSSPADAYPLPTVTYAIVPTSHLTVTNATEYRGLLNNLLAYTGGASGTALPDGYVPLPTSLYKQALVAVLHDLPIPTPPHKHGGGGHKPPVTTTTTSTTTTTTVPPATTTTVPPAPRKRRTVHSKPRTATQPAPKATHSAPKPPPIVHYASIRLVGSASRLAVPLIVGGGSVSALPGALLLARRRARRPRRRKNAEAPKAAAEPATEPVTADD